MNVLATLDASLNTLVSDLSTFWGTALAVGVVITGAVVAIRLIRKAIK